MVPKTHVTCGTDEALVKTCLNIGDKSIVCKDGTRISQREFCYAFDFLEFKNVTDVNYAVKPCKFFLNFSSYVLILTSISF